MNKYHRWHDQIIDRASGRLSDGYSERHHIVPRSLGGSNDPSNIVRLTYREHFLVHWLLTKFTEGKARSKMLHALHRMGHAANGTKAIIVAGWQYAVARKAQRDAVLGCKRSVATKQKMRASNINNPRGVAVNGRKQMTTLERATLAERNRERVFTPQVRDNYRKAQLGKTASADTRAKMSKAHFGRRHSADTRAQMRTSRLVLVRGNQSNAFLSFGA